MTTQRSPHTQTKPCSQPSCTAGYADHRWGQTKAHDEGWFTQRTGEAWCPDHNPEWVRNWRSTRAGVDS